MAWLTAIWQHVVKKKKNKKSGFFSFAKKCWTIYLIEGVPRTKCCQGLLSIGYFQRCVKMEVQIFTRLLRKLHGKNALFLNSVSLFFLGVASFFFESLNFQESISIYLIRQLKQHLLIDMLVHFINQIFLFTDTSKKDTLERRFLASDSLQTVLDYLTIEGFPEEEYKVLSSWPRRDVSSRKKKEITL